jgi:outer membrane receptor for ferric coprogen and ferric-rhodotorulic acid
MPGIPHRRLMLCALFLTGNAMAQALAFDIPKGDLKAALDAYARQSGVQIIYRVDELQGVASPGVHGMLEPLAALDAILAHTGFSARRDRSGALAIVKDSTAPRSAAPRLPPPTTSTSEQAPVPVSDSANLETITITARIEGLAAMRVPTALKEIPQSVSLISQNILQQQNDTELGGALNWATGISVVQINSVDNDFYARGFEITNFHIDGGPPLALTANNLVNTPTDLSEYDHIEVLRGADALFGGIGAPGATISLVRKQPLPEDRAIVSASAGSWNYYRLEGDATGPLGFGGALRGRLVAVGETQDYFYDSANRRRGKLYGVVNCDLMPDTLLIAGGSYEEQSGVPDYNGLPRYDNGDDPRLLRSTSLVFPWNHRVTRTSEGFVELEHHFGSNWKLKVNWTELDQTVAALVAVPQGAINPVTNIVDGSYAGVQLNSKLDQTAMDATLTGGFDWIGRRQEVIVGADFQRAPATAAEGLYVLSTPVDPFSFDPDMVPAPSGRPFIATYTEETQEQYGIYAALRLHPWNRWSLIGGLRDSYIKTWLDETEGLGDSVLNTQSEAHADDGKVAPYGGAGYDINRHYFVYASYAEIFQTNRGEIRSNGTVLPPAAGVVLEAGIKGVWHDGALNGALAGFKIDEYGEAAADPNAPSSSHNFECCSITGTQKSQGAETELSGSLAPSWVLSAGYTYNVNRYVSGTTATTQTPRHLFKLWTDYQLPGSWKRSSVGGGIIAQSSNYVNGTACETFGPLGNCIGFQLPFRIVQGFYSVESVRYTYRISPNWTASLNVNNLFDRTYYQTVGTTNGGNWYGAPRNLLLNIQGRL